MRRRAFVLGALAAAACSNKASPPTSMSDTPARPDEPELEDKEIVRQAPSKLEADVTGTLEARSFLAFAGCVPPGSMKRWLVVAAAAGHFPIALVTPAELATMQAAAADADAGSAPDASGRALLTPDDLGRIGSKVGDKVRLVGLFAPVIHSGTVAATPVYGVCTAAIQRA